MKAPADAGLVRSHQSRGRTTVSYIAALLTAVPAIFEDPFGMASQFIDNPRFLFLIFETPFD
jgi:hypothetical protein